MTTPQFPVEKKFSTKTRARYGYKDGRVEVVLKLGPIPLTEKLTVEEVDEAIAFLQEAQRFATLSPEDRERLGAP